MQLMTKCRIQPVDTLISHGNSILLVGSCFARHIGERLLRYRFQTTVNPFGIIYNPLSIRDILQFTVSGQSIADNRLIFWNSLWHSFLHHSSFSSSSKNDLINHIDTSSAETYDRMKKSDHVFITFGTAWVHTHRKHDFIVANCHKCPEELFEKKILSYDEIIDSLTDIISLVKTLNNKTSIVLTVSPVIHRSDGLVANNRSKSLLCAAAQEVCTHYSLCYYFPAYELMTMELRDYRYYANDLIHPSQMAIQYIWEKFSSVFFSEKTRDLIMSLNSIFNALEHVPFHPQLDSYRKHLEQTLKRIESVEKKSGFLLRLNEERSRIVSLDPSLG